MKILVRVPLSIYSGYGNDGLGLVRALKDWGCDVRIEPTIVQPPIPQDLADLLTLPLDAPFDLMITHVDPGALSASVEHKQATPIHVAWSMWEYSNFGNLPGRSKLKKRLQNFDALVGYDDVTVECFKPYFKKPILKVQGGFVPDDWEYIKRDWTSERFGFCMIGQLHTRKDPFVAIKAFQELKQEHPEEFAPAELHLKTNIPGLHSAMEQVIPKLRIHYDVWDHETMLAFYSKQHVLLSPSRGEGKNMPALEFMSTGGAVIATNWAGHTQWLDKSYSYPLDYTLAPVDGDSPNTYNARADVKHLKELMLQTFRNRAETKQKGDLAARTIPQLCSWDAVVERLFLQIKNNVPGGDTMWAKAIECRKDSDS